MTLYTFISRCMQWRECILLKHTITVQKKKDQNKNYGNNINIIVEKDIL